MKKSLFILFLFISSIQYILAVDESRIYISQDLKAMDLHQDTSTWAFSRSRQSEHFIVFWARDYGTVNPAEFPDEAYRVNIDSLLAKAEEFYAVNVNKLKFIIPGASKTDKYKMQIFILFQKGMVASGAGWDDTIGALWVSPNVCNPAGSIIAHEIGHCFQYQVFCDNGGKSGWRYGFGGNGGNGFWEMTAQWQSFQIYPDQVFTNYYYKNYLADYQLSSFNEEQRYENYFIEFYWANKHGVDFISKMWHESGAKGEEDPAQAYMRLTGINLMQYNKELFDFAQKMVTWDLNAIREYGKNHIGDLTCSLNKVDENYWQVSAKSCPQNHGYNVIRLKVPAAGATVSCDFAGIAGAAGYNAVHLESAGWRYGYVALKKDGTSVYGKMYSATNGKATFKCPADCTDLWFVVLGAPTSYWMHAWDDKADNDEQWPYKVRFSGTNIFGAIDFKTTDKPHDEAFVYNVAFPADATGYNGTSTTIDASKLCYAFVMSGPEIASNLGLPNSDKKIKLYGVNGDGSLFTEKNPSRGFSYWYDAKGDVCKWSPDSTGTNKVYAEFDATKFQFTIGQHPGRSKAGDVYKIKQVMVYGTYKATFEFNITIQ